LRSQAGLNREQPVERLAKLYPPASLVIPYSDVQKRDVVRGSRPLADFRPHLTIAAKNLATEMTNHKVQQADLRSEPAIRNEHAQNHPSGRQMLSQRGIGPEALPAGAGHQETSRTSLAGR
jgi:hypothetical protein